MPIEQIGVRRNRLCLGRPLTEDCLHVALDGCPSDLVLLAVVLNQVDEVPVLTILVLLRLIDDGLEDQGLLLVGLKLRLLDRDE
jgi:hypothetical protein